MHLFLTLLPMLAVSISSMAAPMDTTPADGASTSTSQSNAAQQASNSWEGKIVSWNEMKGTSGPPNYTPLLSKADINKLKKAEKRKADGVHGIIVTKDHGQHVEGAVMSHTLPNPPFVKLQEPASHYGVKSIVPQGQTQQPTYIAKTPIRHVSKADAASLKKVVGFESESISEENLKKLKADLCKRGPEGAACSLRQKNKVANRRPPPSSALAKGGISKAKPANRQTFNRKVANRRPLAQTRKVIAAKNRRPPVKSSSRPRRRQ